MDHTHIRRVLARGIVRVLAPGVLPVVLRDYQREMLESAVCWLRRRHASRFAYVSQATGLGKTIEEAAIVAASAGLRVLLIVPTKIMVTQLMRDMVGFTEGSIAHASSLRHITDIGGDVIATHWRGTQHDVLIATDETFKARAAQIKQELDPHVIIWDESHWSYTKKAQAALAAFPEAVVFAFSATPDYLTTTAKQDSIRVTLDNGQVLYGTPDKFAQTYYPELLDERTARWGIQHKYLAALAWGELDFTFELDDVPVVDGPGGMDYDQAALQAVMRKNWPFVVTTVRKLYQSGQYGLANRYAAAICPGVSEAEGIAEELRGIGLAAEVLTQKTKDGERDAILARGERGELQFLSSVFVLRDGWNAPSAKVAMMLRPTKSRVLYVQFMGRVLRLYSDEVALVLDPHYQNTRFAPLSAPVLFGTPGQAVVQGDILVGGAGVISPYLLDKLQPILTVRPIEIEYWAGKDGTFEANGEVWGGVSACARLLEISSVTIDRRVHFARTRQGKNSCGRVQTFYALSDVRAACADLLAAVPQAGEDGTFEKDGEVWGTVAALARLLEISRRATEEHLHASRTRQGKNRQCRVQTFYSLSDVRAARADLLAAVPQAGEDGTFEKDGEVWGTVASLARLLKIARHSIASRLHSRMTRQGKDSGGNVQTFYSLSDVRAVCSDVKPRKKKHE